MDDEIYGIVDDSLCALHLYMFPMRYQAYRKLMKMQNTLVSCYLIKIVVYYI